MLKLTHPSLAKFSDFVQLKDYRQPTKDEYVRYVRKLGEHYQGDPATLTEDQLRAYFLFLRQQKKFGGSAMKLARCAPSSATACTSAGGRSSRRCASRHRKRCPWC